MKYLPLPLLLLLLGCEKKNREVVYIINPHNNSAVYAAATFTENGNQTKVMLGIDNLDKDSMYMAHIHQGDSTTYGSAPIVLNFGTITGTGQSHTIIKEWNIRFDEAVNYDGCIAVHNAYEAVALGNIGANTIP